MPSTSAAPRRPPAPSVLIISAGMGAGHDGVAYELQRRFEARGATAQVVDYLHLLPVRMGPLYRESYRTQLRYAPATYEWLYGRIDHGPLAPVARWLAQLGRRQVRRLVREGQHTLVVSTFPLGCQASGVLRLRGELSVPAVGFLTDVDVHSLWLHRGVDLNLTVWSGSAAEATRRVGTASRAVGPVLPDTFRLPVSPAERAAARTRLGIADPDTKVVLVVAGSWGVGDIGRTARAVIAAGVGVPVVLCGRNEELRAQLAREFAAKGVGVALGWTPDVRGVMAGADVLVHNAGGLSCLEGFAMGIPVVGHACLPGHGRRNAEAMREAGVAALADDSEQLLVLLQQLAGTPEGARMAGRARAMFVADPTDDLLEMAGAPAPVPAVTRIPAQRRPPAWAVRAAALTAAVPLMLGGLSFGVAEATAHTRVGVAEGDSGVYVAAEIDATQAGDPATIRLLAAHGVSAAVGTGRQAPTADEVAALVRAGVGVVGAYHRAGNHQHPRPGRNSLEVAARAVTGSTRESRPPVVLMDRPTVLQRVVAWDHDVQLARPTIVLHGGPVVPPLKEGDQLVLDLRGHTRAQMAADLAAVSARLDRQGLPERPMRALWHAP